MSTQKRNLTGYSQIHQAAIRTILVPIGRPRHAEAILPWLTAIVDAYKPNVILLHVLDQRIIFPVPARSPVQLLAAAKEMWKEEGLQLLEGVRERLSQIGIDAHMRIARGSVSDKIVEIAAAVGADMVILTSSRKPWFLRIHRGSIVGAIQDRLDR